MNENQGELQILEILGKEGPLHARRIAEELDEHPLSVDRICSRLYETGDIHSCKRGHYQLTERGKTRLLGEFS